MDGPSNSKWTFVKLADLKDLKSRVFEIRRLVKVNGLQRWTIEMSKMDGLSSRRCQNRNQKGQIFKNEK